MCYFIPICLTGSSPEDFDRSGMDFPPAATRRPRLKKNKLKMDTLSQFHFAKIFSRIILYSSSHQKIQETSKADPTIQEYIFTLGPLRPMLVGLAPHPATPASSLTAMARSCCLSKEWRIHTEAQGMWTENHSHSISWVGRDPLRITECNSWLHTGPPYD